MTTGSAALTSLHVLKDASSLDFLAVVKKASCESVSDTASRLDWLESGTGVVLVLKSDSSLFFGSIPACSIAVALVVAPAPLWLLVIASKSTQISVNKGLRHASWRA